MESFTVVSHSDIGLLIEIADLASQANARAYLTTVGVAFEMNGPHHKLKQYVSYIELMHGGITAVRSKLEDMKFELDQAIGNSV